MRFYIFILLFLLGSTIVNGQVIQRNDGETAEQFAERFKPQNAKLTHGVIEMKWNDIPIIIALYKQSYKLPLKQDLEQQSYFRIVGTVFMHKDKNTFIKTGFGVIDTEGGEPNIETVFFANADTDKTKELVVIASWQQQHFDVDGTLYGTFVYDYDLSNRRNDWKLLEKISKKLDGGCECSWSDGSSKKAKFKTAAQVKRELIRLGYK